MRKEPNHLQFRTAATALLIVAVVTAASLCLRWFGPWNEETTLPLILAFVASQVAYALYVGVLRLRSMGVKFGIAAIILNLVAVDANSHAVLAWTVLTVCSIAVALAGISRLLRQAKQTSLG